MKTAAKIFIVLGMIFFCWLIFPVILGIFALAKLETAKRPEELRGWGIATLFLVSLVGGILMLAINQEDLGPIEEEEDRREQNRESAYQKLLELKDLYDKGIIDLETYEARKKILLQYL